MKLERQLLGSMILDPDRLELIAKIRTGIRLKSSAHQIIFRAIVARFHAQPKAPIDLVVIADDLRRSARLVQVGGPEYLAAIINAASPS